MPAEDVCTPEFLLTPIFNVLCFCCPERAQENFDRACLRFNDWVLFTLLVLKTFGEILSSTIGFVLHLLCCAMFFFILLVGLVLALLSLLIDAFCSYFYNFLNFFYGNGSVLLIASITQQFTTVTANMPDMAGAMRAAIDMLLSVYESAVQTTGGEAAFEEVFRNFMENVDSISGSLLGVMSAIAAADPADVQAMPAVVANLTSQLISAGNVTQGVLAWNLGPMVGINALPLLYGALIVSQSMQFSTGRVPLEVHDIPSFMQSPSMSGLRNHETFSMATYDMIQRSYTPEARASLFSSLKQLHGDIQNKKKSSFARRARGPNTVSRMFGHETFGDLYKHVRTEYHDGLGVLVSGLVAMEKGFGMATDDETSLTGTLKQNRFSYADYSRHVQKTARGPKTGRNLLLITDCFLTIPPDYTCLARNFFPVPLPPFFPIPQFLEFNCQCPNYVPISKFISGIFPNAFKAILTGFQAVAFYVPFVSSFINFFKNHNVPVISSIINALFPGTSYMTAPTNDDVWCALLHFYDVYIFLLLLLLAIALVIGIIRGVFETLLDLEYLRVLAEHRRMWNILIEQSRDTKDIDGELESLAGGNPFENRDRLLTTTINVSETMLGPDMLVHGTLQAIGAQLGQFHSKNPELPGGFMHGEKKINEDIASVFGRTFARNCKYTRPGPKTMIGRKNALKFPSYSPMMSSKTRRRIRRDKKGKRT